MLALQICHEPVRPARSVTRDDKQIHTPSDTEEEYQEGRTMIMHDARQQARLPQGRTNGIAMRIAKFGTLDITDLSVRAVDISAAGMSVEADVLLEPGFVWIRDKAGHQQGGVIVWTRACENDICRAGIKFIPLTSGHEVISHANADHPYPPSCHAPGLVACMLVDEVPLREG
jgi:hypothetical protein